MQFVLEYAILLLMETHKYTESELAVLRARVFLQLPRTKTDMEFPCKDCGKPVMWTVSSKTGKTYLAYRAVWESDGFASQNQRHNTRTFYPSHKCTPDAEYQGFYAEAMALLKADREAKLQTGAIVYGQTVEVYKGKKIPVGTTGVVFWVAPEADKYGTIKAGFKTADDEKVFVNIDHLRAVK